MRLSLRAAIALASLTLLAGVAVAQETSSRQDAGVAPRRAPRPLRSHQIHPRSVALEGHDYLAAEGGDLDGDGRDELLLVRAGAVGVVRTPDGRAPLTVIASTALPAPAPPLFGRRVFAVGRISGGRALFRVSDRATEFSLTLDQGALSVTERPASCGPRGYRLEDACALNVEGRDYFASQLESLPGAQEPRPASGSFYVRRRGTFTGGGETAVSVEAIINPRGRLSVTAGTRSASLLGVGSALALGDIEGDGTPELLTSVDDRNGSPEHLVLLRVRPRDARITSVYRSRPLEGRVLVAGSGDLDGDGDDELFAIEERGSSARLWVLP